MAKKRKINYLRVILIILILLLLFFVSFWIIKFNLSKKENTFNISDLKINEIDYSSSKEFDFDLNSKEYLLMRLNDYKVLYSKGNDIRIYPASLTKILTMDTVLSNVNDVNETSYFTDEQYYELISEDSSMAGLKTYEDYSIDELLNALVLPSGGDAAVCLENYFNNKGLDLIDEMNNKCSNLNLTNSHFTNPTGLHDDNLYTSLDDYAKIVIDTLFKDGGKKVLKTNEYITHDNIKCLSTLSFLTGKDDVVKVYGGKTGYTLEAGMNIMCLFEADNRSYLLILANAPGSPYEGGVPGHIEDVKKILDNLFRK